MARILIIEDEANNLDVARRIVRGAGHEALTATDGMAGLEMARRERPDAILVDLLLPGAQERAAVTSALAELPEEQRHAVLLAYFGGFTQAEIAELTRVPLSTVKGRMRLALDKLATYLRERGLVDV